MKTLAVACVALPLATAGCGSSDSQPAGGGGSGGSGGGQAGAGANSGAGGVSGAAGAAPCLLAAEPFGIDPAHSDSFPDVQLTSCDGTKQKLDALRCQNKLTLLSIGAGWCAPCKEETPDLQVVNDALAKDGFGVVQVLFEDADANPASTLFCKTWVDAYSLTIPVFIDPAGNALKPAGTAAIPVNVALDHDGKVLWAKNGTVPADLLGTMKGLLAGL